MFSFLRTGIKKVYEIDKKVIGKGQFATVRRAVHRQTGQEVAVKKIHKDRLKKNMVSLNISKSKFFCIFSADINWQYRRNSPEMSLKL
jgi:serine/threonine protein kinase